MGMGGRKLINLTGEAFGRLLVLEQAPSVPGRCGARWRVLCSCGKRYVVDSANLRSGRLASCGCAGRDPRTTPPPPPVPGARWIPLTRGAFALVDADDYERVVAHRWYLTPVTRKSRKVYARTHADGTRRKQPMHRFILDVPPGVAVDHADGNGLNNRRSNLRVATKAQNMWNVGPRLGRPLKGAAYNRLRNKWYSAIQANGEHHYLGCYETAEEAARAYDEAAVRLHGAFARLNFPEPSPN